MAGKEGQILGERRVSPTAEQVAAGQAVYTKRVLRAYDLFVLGVSNRFVWKCPTPRLLEHYNLHVTANHLDVGVGTGYYLDKCRFPSAAPRVALLDLNPEALEFAAQRIARLRPETYVRNALEPIAIEAPGFDSVAVNYLLHCLPGPMSAKSVIFDHLKAHMNPGAVLFGSTLLYDDVPLGWFGRRLMDTYNARGIFSNRQDTRGVLEGELAARFRDVSVHLIGCAALFVART